MVEKGTGLGCGAGGLEATAHRAVGEAAGAAARAGEGWASCCGEAKGEGACEAARGEAGGTARQSVKGEPATCALRTRTEI